MALYSYNFGYYALHSCSPCSYGPYSYCMAYATMPYTVRFIVPAKANETVGYTTMMIRNTDGAESRWPLEIYYSERCPDDDWYGSGLSCRL